MTAARHKAGIELFRRMFAPGQTIAAALKWNFESLPFLHRLSELFPPKMSAIGRVAASAQR
jgi:hypothetical protein